MELELRNISPYLPYGLKFVLSQRGIFNLDNEYGNPQQVYKPMEISNVIMGDEINIEIQDPETGYSIGFIELDEVLPVLRPLSDLNKLIEVDGYGLKFIPLVQLAKLSFRKWDSSAFKLSEFENYVQFSTYYFSYNKNEMSFDCKRNYNGKKWDYNCYVPYQMDLLNKLFEWHFDVFELIKAGNAIDINTQNI